jgi:hypothetical protein
MHGGPNTMPEEINRLVTTAFAHDPILLPERIGFGL